MNSRNTLLLAIIGVLLFTAWKSGVTQDAAPKAPVVRWEYHTWHPDRPTADKNDEKLNELGELGWELVTAELEYYEEHHHGRTYYFKRPK